MKATVLDSVSTLSFQTVERDFAIRTKGNGSVISGEFARPVFDDSYLTRLRTGDEETAKHFDSYFRRLLRRWIWGKFTWEQAEELVDSAMAVAFEKIVEGQPRDAARLPAYVTGICLNLTRLALRSGVHCVSKDPEDIQIADRAPDAEERLLKREQAQEVRNVLKSLGTRDRGILVDLFFHEKKREEVCERYGVDRERLRLILFRARKRFQSGWEGRGEAGGGAGELPKDGAATGWRTMRRKVEH
jgi:RNA polymerase sigma factor (sigma-70 family)